MPKEALAENRTAQRQRTRNRLAEVVASEWRDKTRLPFAQALHRHFDDLPITWEKFVTPQQIYTLVPSVFGALSLANFIKNREFPQDSMLDTPDKCLAALLAIHADPVGQPIFDNMLGELPVTVNPERTLPIYYAIRHMFRSEPEKPLVIVDLGGATGYTLTSLLDPNTYNRVSNFPGQTVKKLYGSPKELPVLLGVNVDKLTREEAILRANAYGNDRQRNKMDRMFTHLDEQRFPHVITDLTQTDKSLSAIQSEIKRVGRTHADVVIRSFVDYQVNDTMLLDDLTFKLLGKGGICVIMGDELLDYNNNLNSAVSVFRKGKSESLDFIGMPFLISDGGIITRTQLDFFLGTDSEVYEIFTYIDL